MLRELRIENLLLIERAELRLAPGLNSITGETGAGKTILAHALDLLMGGKPRPGVVRPGTDEAWVEGSFDLPAGLLEEAETAEVAERLPAGADELVLGRRVSAAGRSAAFVAGRSASAADLRLLGSRLLSFYGQHEHRKLVLAAAQGEILDAFAGSEHLERRRAYAAEHRECRRLRDQLERLRDRDGTRERDLDLFRYELSEIEAAAPDPAEEAELAIDRERLRHAESLRAAAAGALAAVSGGGDDEGGAAGILAAAEAGTASVAGVDPELDRSADRLAELAVDLGDLGSELRAYIDSVESDPERLAAIEERLEALDRLKRKHGGSLEAVIAHGERCREEIERLETGDALGSELEEELEAALGRREKLAERLGRRRADAATALEAAVATELEGLAMPGARLEVGLHPHPEGFGPTGRETVELRVATNPGIEPAPLRDAASGGELSRVMLALSGVGEGAGTATLVFDEIDAGVGGRTATAVGERLKALGRNQQVLCITHLPQVASFAAAHFRIEKTVSGGESSATVERVDGDDLVAEIARMLGGGRADDAASRHARELLAAA